MILLAQPGFFGLGYTATDLIETGVSWWNGRMDAAEIAGALVHYAEGDWGAILDAYVGAGGSRSVADAGALLARRDLLFKMRRETQENGEKKPLAPWLIGGAVIAGGLAYWLLRRARG